MLFKTHPVDAPEKFSLDTFNSLFEPYDKKDLQTLMHNASLAHIYVIAYAIEFKK